MSGAPTFGPKIYSAWQPGGLEAVTGEPPRSKSMGPMVPPLLMPRNFKESVSATCQDLKNLRDPDHHDPMQKGKKHMKAHNVLCAGPVGICFSDCIECLN